MKPVTRAVARFVGARPIVVPIPPGTKARLTHADDARLFGWTRTAPLLERADG